MDCIDREIQKNWGALRGDPRSSGPKLLPLTATTKESLHQRWLSSLREIGINLNISGHMWTLEQDYKNWIYLVGKSYFCIYLFTHEWKFSFIWFINRSFKFKLAVSNLKFFILWKRKVQLRIRIAWPSVIKYHQAISYSALEVIRPNGEG